MKNGFIMKNPGLGIILLLLLIPLQSSAQINQWRGPDRTGHYPGTGLLKSWPDGGPELIFEATGIGEGFSSPVEHRGTIYETGKKDTIDLLTALTLEGDILWQVPYGRSWVRSMSNTRSTPTLEGNMIYLIGGTGRLVCLDAGGGEEIWSVDVDEQYEAEWHSWGVAESPLIVDDLVICSPAGKKTTLAAFNKFTGEEVWKSRPVGGKRSYVSPMLYDYEGLRLVLGMTSQHVYAADPETGEIRWTFPYYKLNKERAEERGEAIMTNTPLFHENEVFITTGYDYPSVMLKMDPEGRRYTEKWRSETLDNHHGHVVLHEGRLYASNWLDNRRGHWVCLDWETGEVLWDEKWQTKGSIIAADGMLYLYEEKDGNVGLIKADPQGFDLAGTLTVQGGKGPHWAHPGIYNGKLLIRHGDYLAAYDISE